MQLIIITPESTLHDEAETVNRLFARGLLRLHVRKPMFTIDDYRNYLAGIEQQYHLRISIHGCFELFSEFRLGGIHLNSAARQDKEVIAQVALIAPPILSSSFHSWQEIEENEARYDYVFISPVFDSISKAGYKAGIRLNGAKEVEQKLAAQDKYCPDIIGLGGVGVHNLETLHQNGFDGAAMLGSIWQQKDPVAAFCEAMRVADLFKE